MRWQWADVGAELDIDVVAVTPNEKVMFLWPATGTKTKVTLCCCLKAYLQHGINLRSGRRAEDASR